MVLAIGLHHESDLVAGGHAEVCNLLGGGRIVFGKNLSPTFERPYLLRIVQNSHKTRSPILGAGIFVDDARSAHHASRRHNEGARQLVFRRWLHPDSPNPAQT
jgi:hypothetical protein